MPTKFLRFKCPVCGKTIAKIIRLPEPPELEKIAIKHSDHIIVITYDWKGVIRTVNTFEIKNFISKRNDILRCPICQKEIIIPETEDKIAKFAFLHTDHVVIIYIFRKKYYALDIVKLENFVEMKYRNILDEVISILGLENLSKIFYEILVDDIKTIYVSDNVIEKMKDLFDKLDIADNIILLPGEQNFDDISSEKIKYIAEILKRIRELPENESIIQLNSHIIFIKKIIKLAVKTSRSGLPNITKEILSNLDENLKIIVLDALRKKIPIDLYFKILNY